MTACGSLRVVYVDNDPLALDAFKHLLQDSGGIEFEAVSTDTADLTEACRVDGPCVVLVDLYFNPGEPDGVEVAKRVRDACPHVAVAVCTASEVPADAARVWSAGIGAYLTKQELLRRRRTIASVLWAVWECDVVYQIDPRGGATANPLSAREIEVLRRKLDGQPHRQIADELYLSTRTIDSHLANARGKLGADSIPKALQLAVELGYVEG